MYIPVLDISILYSVVLYRAVMDSAELISEEVYSAELYSAVLCIAVLNSLVMYSEGSMICSSLYNVVRWFTVLYSAVVYRVSIRVQCCRVLYNKVQYYNVMHCLYSYLQFSGVDFIIPRQFSRV